MRQESEETTDEPLAIAGTGAMIQKHILRSHHHHCMKSIGQSPIGAELIQFDETFRFVQALNASAAANPCVRVSTGPVIGSVTEVTWTDKKKGGVG